MCRKRRILSLFLSLVLVLSLFGGASVLADGEGFHPAAALEEGYEYLIVAQDDGKAYALSFDGAKLGAAEVAATAEGVAAADASLCWRWHSDDTLESVGTPGAYLFAGSGGFTTWDSSMLRTCRYDPSTGTVKLHTKYWLAFADGAFDQTEDAAAAVRIELYARETALPEAAASGPVTYEPASALESGYNYLVVTEVDGKFMSLRYAGGLNASEVTVADGKVTTDDASLVWVYHSADSTMESLGTRGQYIFAGSGGFMTFTGGRTFVYNSDTETVNMHTSYVLGFSRENGAFTASKADADAVKVLLFRAKGEEEVVEVLDDTPVSVPETVVKQAVKAEDGSIRLAFAADVHYSLNYAQNNLQVWLENLEPSVGFLDSMGFCGDMGSAYASSAADYWSWTQAVMNYMDAKIQAGKVGSTTYTFGNHEWFPAAGGDYYHNKDNPAAQRLQRMGESIRTEDYIFYNFGAGKIASTYTYDYDDADIAALDAYLQNAPTDIPIFILTHFPLHAWSGDLEVRVIKNSQKVIDVLNKYPNVVVLWGHNHSDFDANYDAVCRAGSTIVIDKAGTTATINFDYLSAGCISDEEYTGANGGSAWVLGKGLVVTIGADGALTYDYYTMDGKKLAEHGPYLVEFRDGVNYTTVKTEYVEAGKAAAAPAAPELKGYTFLGWDIAFDRITTHTVVTGQYEKVVVPAPELTSAAPLDAAFVYVTIQDGQNTAIGKTGAPIALYPIPYTAGMTIGDAFVKAHELEYAGGVGGITVADSGYGFSSMTRLWGRSPVNGSLAFDPTSYVDAAKSAAPGACYYALAYDSAWISTSLLAPGKVVLKAPGSVTLSAFTMNMNSDYTYSALGINGDVYVGTDVNALADSGVDSEDGYFTLRFDQPGDYVVAVRSAVGEAMGFVTIQSTRPDPTAKPGSSAYTVTAGDTLWSIAQKYFGTGRKWGLVYEANASLIPNPSMIYVGQVLSIPMT